MFKLPIKACSALALSLALSFDQTATAAPQAFVVTNDAGQTVAGAAVAIFVKGEPSNTSGKTLNMAQKDRAFDPKLLVIQTGTAVNFPNFDTVRHHVYSFSSIKPFEIKLYAGRPTEPIVFDKPGTATLGCNIHDSMLGYIHVVDTPYFGITEANGLVTLDLPAGEHRVRVWHPSMGEVNPGQEFRAATSATPIALKIKN